MSLLGASLLLSMLELVGIAAGSNTRIIRKENGKPYFPAMSELCFSISHSDGVAACALSEAGEVGVDLEFIPLPESSRMAERRRSIASRWLAPRGMDAADDTPEGFLMGWTAFEATSKYSGGTLSSCRAVPEGTLLDRFIKKDENRVGILTLCRNSENTVEALPSVRENGFVPTNIHSRSTVTVLGVAFDRITLKEALRRADCAIKNGGEVMTVVTPNPVISMMCYKDAEFGRIVNSASISLADGRGVIDAAKRLKTPLPERVAGIDFGYGLLQLAAAAHAGVFLLGGKPGRAKKAAERLKKELPGLDICGVCNGYGEAENEAALASAIYASKPRILIVCLGSPRQERWMHEHLSLLRKAEVGVAAALGGAVDVWSGEVSRAPEIFIRMRLEWLWRFAAQPRRLKNLPLLVRYRMLTRKKRSCQSR